MHIDNGFMRKNESMNVEASLSAVGLQVEVAGFCTLIIMSPWTGQGGEGQS